VSSKRQQRAAAAPARDISPGRKRFVQVWTTAWGVIGAVIVVFIAYHLPAQLQAGDGPALLRSAGLGLICLNLILQATKAEWPIVYALPMTVAGITVWLIGWLA
jgi:hypothetical protein